LSEAVASKEVFFSLLEKNQEKRADSFLVSSFFSFSPLVAREVVYKTCGRTDVDVYEIDRNRFFDEAKKLNELIENKRFVPTLSKSRRRGNRYSFNPMSNTGTANMQTKKSFPNFLISFSAKKRKPPASSSMRPIF
jgi:DNA topoisomerase VI subunit B